jgi:hypothetical protein
MPHSSGRLSASKTYHVMIRGNEREELFLADDDRAWFVSMLALKNRKRKFAINKWNIKLEELLNGANITIRNELILELKQRSNLSNRQIADVLRVNRNVV